MPVLALVLHAALMLAGAPVFAGLLRGSGHPQQAWRDLRKLARKPGLHSGGAVGAAAPVVAFAASLVAALLVPSFTLGMATAPLADLVLLAGLFAVSRAAIMLAGAESGSGLAALAAQRWAVLRLLADPALLVLMLVIAVATGSGNLDAASAALRDGGPHPALVPGALAAVVVLLAGVGPGEIDREYAGRDLAILHFAAQLRFLTLLSLLAALTVPFGLAPAGSGLEAWVPGAALWAVKVAALGALAVVVRARRARLRPDQAPELAALGLLLALIAAALLFAGQRAA